MNSEETTSFLTKRKLRLLLVTLVFAFWIPVSQGQTNEQSGASTLNQLTIYVIPSKVKYDWSSPRTLYKSFIKNYKRNLFTKKGYLLGHAFIALRSPRLEEEIVTGMRSADRNEQKNMLLKAHYGLAVLGADMAGKMEQSDDLEKMIGKYSRKGRLAFMDFLVSDEAMDRMIRYLQSYKSYFNEEGRHGARYGGAFWPRYKGEGAGCSAFAVSFLDLAGLLTEEFEEWLVSIDIPMELIGGPYNHDNEVRLKDIRRAHAWANPDSVKRNNYEHIEIFDPFLMYEWIEDNWQEQAIAGDFHVSPQKVNEAKGLSIDARNQPLPGEDRLFLERESSSIFIDFYKNNSHSQPIE